MNEVEKDSKPNVILLTIDSLRAEFPSSDGPQAGLTPNLNRLADTAIRFDQAISGGSWTQAAFPVLLTSSYAGMYGGCLSRLAPERPSAIESLVENGYSTGGFSTNLHLSRHSAYDRGFTTFEELIPVDSEPWLRGIPGGQLLLRNALFHTLIQPFGIQMRPGRLYSSAAELVDGMCSWIERVETPFFAWAHFMDMHWPYHLGNTSMNPRAIALEWQDLAIMHGRSNFNRSKPIDDQQRQRFTRLYQQSLIYLDSQLGRLFARIKEMGFGENTLVVLVSDHGEEFLEHERWGHWESNLFDEILKVPLIMRLPFQPRRLRIKQQVRILDLMPTILDICNCPAPTTLMGQSMSPLWTDQRPTYDVEVSISEMRRDPWHRIALRTENFKYIWDNKRPNQPELYDLQADPGEKHNVSQNFPQEIEQFNALIEEHLSRVAATEPLTSIPQLEYEKPVEQRLRDLGYL